MRPFAKNFYTSPAWKSCRDAYIRSVGYLCEDCMKNGIVTAAEEVHHIIELTPENINDPTITLNPDNLVALCREHHRRRHSKREARYIIGQDGSVTPL